MRFDTDRSKEPLNMPFVAEGVEAGARFDYNALARFAYGLLKHNHEILPAFRFGGRSVEQKLFAECIRQSCLRALERFPDRLFEEPGSDTLSATKQRQELKRQVQGIAPSVRERVDRALDEAETLASAYFDPDREDPSPADGLKLLMQIVEHDRHALEKQLDEGFYRH